MSLFKNPDLNGVIDSNSLDSARSKSLLVCIAYAGLGALTLSPLLSASIPPLVDYPDHLARMWILIHGSENYVAKWHLLPTLAMELIVLPLAQIMPVEMAGRLFIALTMLLPVIGTMALHRVLHGRIGLWPLCALLFVYNAAFYWGFLDFIFGFGVALIGFAGWIASAEWHTIRRVILFSVVVCVIYILHLFAFGIYGLLVASYELGDIITNHRWSPKDMVAEALRFAQFVPAVLIWSATLSNAGPMYNSYGGIQAKIMAISAPITLGLLIASLIASIIVWASFYICWRRGILKFSSAMRLPIFAMIVAGVVMPDWLFGSWGADFRLPVALPFVLIASSQPQIQRRSVVHLMAAVAVILLAVRVGALTLTWRAIDSRFSEFRMASRVIPKGARVLIVESHVTDKYHHVDGLPLVLANVDYVQFFHMPSLAVMDRDVFIPYQFTGWTVIKPAARDAGMYNIQGGGPLTPTELAKSMLPVWRERYSRQRDFFGEVPYWVGWAKKFDYVLWINFGKPGQLLPGKLKLLVRGSFFKIYQVLQSDTGSLAYRTRVHRKKR